MNMNQLLKNLMTKDPGQDAIEDALVAIPVDLDPAAARSSLMNSISNTFGGVGNAISNAAA